MLETTDRDALVHELRETEFADAPRTPWWRRTRVVLAAAVTVGVIGTTIVLVPGASAAAGCGGG